MSFDTTKLSNFGKNVAKDYGRFRKSNDKMGAEIKAALEAGLSPERIERELMKHINSDEERVDLASVVLANEQIEERKRDGKRD
jgi:hypothetical protein